MKKLLLSISGLVLGAASTFSVAADRVGDFALIDHQGVFHHMAWYDDQEAVVLMIQANGAPEVRDSLANFEALNTQYAEQGVLFMMMNPGLQTDRSEVQQEANSLGTDLPILMDDAQLVSETLGVSRIGEAVIYNPKSFEVVYRGPVQEHLETALQQYLNGDEVQSTATASGAMVDYPALAMHNENIPSYSADVAPIIADNCAACHRAEGIAPFALDSHMSAQGWSPMIREVVMTKRMPPGQVDNKVGLKVKDSMNLSDAEMQTLVHWINAGAPVDGDVDPLTQLTWPESKWQLGEPDLIVQIPPSTIPATGVVDYMDIPVDLNLDRDVWIKGSEVAPGDPTVLHHIITTVVPPEGAPDFQQILMDILNGLPEEQATAIRTQLFTAIASGTQPNISEIFANAPDIDIGAFLGSSDPNMASIAGYAPGASIEFNPDGTGGLLKAGSSLSLQMHYTTSGRETTDNSEIGIYFYPEGEEPNERMSGGVGNDFTINVPAQAKDHEMEVTVVVPEEAYLYSFMPHMHFRGKRMEFKAVYPDGSEELLVSVPNYSFNWQLSHSLEEPLLVPAGTKIVATGAFDNSSQNAFNPDPNSPVYWGEQSWEEMFMGFYSWKNVDQGGE